MNARGSCSAVLCKWSSATTKNTAICHLGQKILEKQMSKQAKAASLLVFVMVFFSSIKTIKGFYNN